MADTPQWLRERLSGLDPGQRTMLAARLREARRKRPAAPVAAAPERAAVPINSTGTAPALFLLHTSGGSVLPYAALAAELDPDQACWGLPAAGLVEDPDHTVDALVEHCVAGLRSVQPQGPYRLAGWSAGGVLAFAAALRLRAAGARTSVLVVLDAEPPPQLAEPPDVPTALALFAADYASALGRPPVAVDPTELAGLPPAVQRDRVVARLAEQGLVQPDLAAQVRARAHTFVATVRAGATWRPARWDGRIDLLLSDEVTDPAAAAAGWQRLTTGPVVASRVPGDHYSMMRPPHVAAVAAALTAALAR